MRYADSAPPNRTHAQQQLARLITGSADNTPIVTPPRSAGCNLAGGIYRSLIPDPRSLVVILPPEVSNHLLTHHVTQRVLQLHQLDEQVVLGIQVPGVHRRLEVERQPLLDARHP